MTDSDVPKQQREVQRLLGRCLLRLQQYEKLMKSLVAYHEFKGSAQELAHIQAQRVDDLMTNTLGILVKRLLGSYIVADKADQPLLNEETTPTDAIAIGFRMSLHLSAVDYAQTELALAELVTLRNSLVHHFIDQFDLWTVDGCVAARDYLNACYACINRHFEQLRSWTDGMENMRALAATFMQTQEFSELVVNGIAPDGTMQWADAGIVLVLREAAAELNMRGWTRLDDAVAVIAERHPEQTPPKYGCRSWGQVLSESRIFELQYRTDEDDSRVAWFKERKR